MSDADRADGMSVWAGYISSSTKSMCEASQAGVASSLYNVVRYYLLDKQWFPEQISGVLKKQFPKQASMQVGHETIYRCIYAHPKDELKK